MLAARVDEFGGETLARAFALLGRGGVLASSAAEPDQREAERRGVRARFFLVAVTTERLNALASLLQSGSLRTHVGEVLPLDQVRVAHQMLAGVGKVRIDASQEGQEIQTADTLACCRSHLSVAMTTDAGATTRRAGQVLTVYRKGADGRWRLFRDANLMLGPP